MNGACFIRKRFRNAQCLLKFFMGSFQLPKLGLDAAKIGVTPEKPQRYLALTLVFRRLRQADHFGIGFSRCFQ